MEALADKLLGKLHFTLEQVQDLTPTPMTLSSVMFYTGTNPYTGEEVYVARTQDDKRRQKSYFFGGELPEDRLHGREAQATYRGQRRQHKGGEQRGGRSVGSARGREGKEYDSHRRATRPKRK